MRPFTPSRWTTHWPRICDRNSRQTDSRCWLVTRARSRSTRSFQNGGTTIWRPISPIRPLQRSCVISSSRNTHRHDRSAWCNVRLVYVSPPCHPICQYSGWRSRSMRMRGFSSISRRKHSFRDRKSFPPSSFWNAGPQPLIETSEREAFFRLVTAGFAQKRKTILNSLSASLPADREVMRERLDRLGIDPMRRAETLSVEDWILLLRASATA